MTIPTALRRRRATVLLAALLAALPLALAACGASGDEQDAEALLNRAFSKPIPSADVEIDAELEVDGLQGFEEPVRIRAAGPYIRSKNTLPKLDIDLEIGTAGAGQAVESGLLSTGDRVFLKFGGSFFEQPQAQVASANRRLARDGGDDGGSLADLGLDPRAWVVDASVEGEEEIDGVTTEHIKGVLDIEAAVTDLNDLVKRSAGALGDSETAPRALRERDIERLTNSVEDPSFDVYVGKDDDVIRRISLRLDVDVPESVRQDVNGVTGAAIRFSAELSDIGGDQKVQAPRTSQPIANLTQQLGGSLGALAGGLGGGGTTDGTTPDPQSDGGSGSTDDGGVSGDAGVEDFERYGQCLEQADPDDTAAIARCAEPLSR